MGPKVAIFVHFDAQGSVGPHVLHYVRALRDTGLSVVFVTNAGKLRPDALAALQPLCAGIVVRRNIGYDFGAMREGLECLGLPRADTEMVILANDSIYGPLKPLTEMVQKIDFNVADFWGATESWQTRYHLQSFFLAAGRQTLTSKAWRQFWEDVRPVRSKVWVVNQYEVGLTQKMVRAGLRCAPIWPYCDLVKDVDAYALMDIPKDRPESKEPMITMRGIHAHRIRHSAATQKPLNPTSDLWRQLLRAGFPFIKRELLRDNPSQVADINDWRDVVRRNFGGVPDVIERDLQKAMRNRAP
ncbi:rhamnan synthesis F family protein [Rhodovastum sp. RN2-1]|uniref:Rhamnan synthesis F family protein n=1 Tax=Limobrevibacterium gyesilva TaxID=2991712 RepID=A0AA42CFS9_9PROT|nr:rhamnan synthesis F family protein [Limobrevibacterium gyesilva]